MYSRTRPAPSPTLPPTPAAAPNGLKLKMLIDCFANYMADASYRPDNSRREGCKDKDIIYCRTDSGRNDHFCRWVGGFLLGWGAAWVGVLGDLVGWLVGWWI